MDFLIDNNIVADYETENIMLFNRDCLEVLEAIPNNSIDCIISDPPYRITRRGGGKKKQGKKYCGGIFDIKNNDEETIKNIRSGKLFTHNNIKFEDWLPILHNVLKDGGHCYLMTNYQNYDTMLQVAKQVGFIHCNTIIWIKGNKTSSNCSYMRSL